MKIVIYALNPNSFDSANVKLNYFPSRKSQLEELVKKFPNDEFILFCQKPALLLADLTEEFNAKIIFTQAQKSREIANEICALKPDVAVAASFWQAPYDWLMVKDAVVAEQLKAAGIKTICNSVETGLTFFDKWETYQSLKAAGFKVSKAVHVVHELFWAERTHKESVISNPYKEAVLAQIKAMRYPVVIKDTVGLSSYQMEVCEDYGQASNYLQSKKNSSDRIVEEYVDGIQAGLEIHGTRGNYKILPPMLFSVNKYGITSPKQSVKAGPVDRIHYKVDVLEKTMLKLAEFYGFEGIVQVDLVFSKSEWYIIEVNPRMSGMTSMYSVYHNQSVLNTIINAADLFVDPSHPEVHNPDNYNPEISDNPNGGICDQKDIGRQNINSKSIQNPVVLNIKFPILTLKQMQDLYNCEYIKYVSQIHNTAAHQERERGYCEVILTADNKLQMDKNLTDLQNRFKEIIEEDFVKSARQLITNL